MWHRSATGSCLNHGKFRRLMSGKKTDSPQDEPDRVVSRPWEANSATEETAPSVVSQNGPELHTLVANGPMLPSRSVSTTFIFAFRCVHAHSGMEDWESWLTQVDVDGMVTAKLTQCHQRVVHADHLRYALPLFSLAIHLPRDHPCRVCCSHRQCFASLLSILDLIKM
jgi:hypothetical protein